MIERKMQQNTRFGDKSKYAQSDPWARTARQKCSMQLQITMQTATLLYDFLGQSLLA